MTAPDWTADPAEWEPHVATKTHPRAVENCARKHGRALGNDLLVLLARQLRKVDVVDGCALDGSTAWARVETWAHEGPKGDAP